MSSVGLSRKPRCYADLIPRLVAEPSYGWYEHQLRDTMIERRVVRQGSEPEQYRYGTVHRVVALRGLGNSAELSEAITATHSDPLGRVRTPRTRIGIQRAHITPCHPRNPTFPSLHSAMTLTYSLCPEVNVAIPHTKSIVSESAAQHRALRGERLRVPSPTLSHAVRARVER